MGGAAKRFSDKEDSKGVIEKQDGILQKSLRREECSTAAQSRHDTARCDTKPQGEQGDSREEDGDCEESAGPGGCECEAENANVQASNQQEIGGEVQKRGITTPATIESTRG